jgi:hypothetical protein
MSLSTFPAGGQMWLYFLNKPDLHLEGGSYFGGVRGLWQLIMTMRPKERVKKGKERIDESGGNVGAIWLNHDREEWVAIEELKGTQHEWSFWNGPQALGNRRNKLRPIVCLQGGREAKPWDNICDQNCCYCGGPFVSYREGFHPSCEGVYQYKVVFNFLYWGHMCKVHQPVHGREASSGLVDR